MFRVIIVFVIFVIVFCLFWLRRLTVVIAVVAAWFGCDTGVDIRVAVLILRSLWGWCDYNYGDSVWWGSDCT